MAKIALITGSGGLIGSEAVEFFSDKFEDIFGIDNNMRKFFLGEEASNQWNIDRLLQNIANYTHLDIDIRNLDSLQPFFRDHNEDIKLIIHTAAQPSHEWAATDPLIDFAVNATGTLNLIELTRQYCPNAVFIYISTNKVYGDTPNSLPLIELETRWEVDEKHPFYEFGIDETMSIDQSKHSIFGVSKASADLMVQEYGRYFGIKTAVFRCGCLTGPRQSATRLHGFLAYLMKCAVMDIKYCVYGYKGKQVRDNIHSFDLINMFWQFYQAPRIGEVYNVGGSRHSNCSMLEAINLCEEITGKKINWTYMEANRIGDHIWWISDVRKFQRHYPDWNYEYNLQDILTQIYNAQSQRESDQ